MNAVNSSPIERRVASTRMWTYIATFSGLTILAILLQMYVWRGSTQLHTIMELLATLTALFVGVLALVRFYTKRNNTHLFIGVGFIGTALLDGYHAIVTSSFFHEFFPSLPPSLIPWSWNASRTFLSVLMVLSWWVWRREEKLGERGRINEKIVYLVVSALTAVSFIVFAFVPLGRAYFPELFFGRPEEFLSAALFLTALIGYLSKKYWQHDSLESWLVISLIVGLTAQAMAMSRSFVLFDAMFDLAHLLKIVSYGCVLIGLMIDMYYLFKQAEQYTVSLQQDLRRLAKVFQEGMDPILIEDLAGNVMDLNDAAVDAYGWTREELLGQPIKTIVPPDKHAQADELQARCRQGETVRNVEGLRQTKSGDVIPMLLTLSLFKDEANQPVGVATLAKDIRDLKKNEQTIRDREERIRAIVETAADGIITIDQRGIIESSNPAADRLFGYTTDEMVGQNVRMLMPNPYKDEHDGYVQNFLTTSEKKIIGTTREVVGQRKDGTTFPIDLAVSEMRLGDKPAFTGIVRDIAERKRAEQELARHAAELERSNQELEQFAYIASHDLKEPLRMVGSYTQLLAEEYQGKLDEEADKYIGYATDGAKRMQQLVDALLKYSRVGRADAPMDPVDLQETVELVLANLEVARREADAHIEVGSLPTVSGSRTEMMQLFQNLIGNALKFRGEDTPVIGVSCEAQGENWEITVQDNGIGIEPEYRERIFQIFQRLHTRDEYPGTGIGLSMCKKIVEYHGGRIWIESEPGEGTTFHFTLRKEHIPQVHRKESVLV